MRCCLRILESYIKCYKCIDSFDGSSLKLLSDELITNSDGIVNLITSQKKALKAHNVSELNLLLTAMRAIVMVCSSKEELNLKTPVSKFVKFIEERDKIDTRLTVSEDYFTYLINAYNNFKAEIKGTLCIPPIAHSEKNSYIRQLIPRLYKYPEKCYNNHKVQRSPRKSRDSVEQDGS